MEKENRKQFIFWLIFVLAITFFVWHRVLGQALLGEGPTYFAEPYVSMIEKSGFLGILERHDVGPLLFFYYAKSIFKDNHFFYMLFLLFGEMLVVSSLYFVVNKFTKSIAASVFSSIFFAANYAGSFEILGLGYYQWFIQRVPYFAITLLSFYFLHIFIDKKEKQHYFLSLGLYLLALVLAHYSMLILPLFLIYPYCVLISDREKRFSKYFLELIRIIPFVVGTYLIIYNQPIKAEMGLMDFLKKFPDFIKIIFREIAVLTIPPDLIVKLSSSINKFDSSGVLNLGPMQLITAVSFLMVVVMAMFVMKIYKEDKKLKAFFVSVFLSIFPITFMAMYLNPYFFQFIDGSRYLYLSSLFVACFWGISLFYVSKNNLALRGIIIAVLTLSIIHNRGHITQKFDDQQERHDVVLTTFDFVRNNEFPSNSIVFVHPHVGFYGSEMIWFFHSKGALFLPSSGNMEDDILDLQEKPEKIFFLKYKDRGILKEEY